MANMRKRLIACILCVSVCSFLLAGCAASSQSADVEGSPAADSSAEDQRSIDSGSPDAVTPGTQTFRGFVLDNVLHDGAEGAIHFNLYIPDSYDGSQEVPLFVTLPGYQGLYFQGVGENLKPEDFPFEAQKYDPDMIVAAPQLSDWGETSARQTIALVEYLMEEYAIDEDAVFLEGYSGGGETLSQVMGMSPQLFARALFCASQWDGDLGRLADSKVPVYMIIGENDEYYGSAPAKQAANALKEEYRKRGVPEEEIGCLVTLDVRDADYFSRNGMSNQHGGGAKLFSHDSDVMGWLFDGSVKP